jgi:hypothetical protein
MADSDASSSTHQAFRIACQHAQEPLAPAVIHLVDELARVQAILVSQGQRIADLLHSAAARASPQSLPDRTSS